MPPSAPRSRPPATRAFRPAARTPPTRRFRSGAASPTCCCNDEPAEKCNGLINRSSTDQSQYGRVRAAHAARRHAGGPSQPAHRGRGVRRQPRQLPAVHPARLPQPGPQRHRPAGVRGRRRPAARRRRALRHPRRSATAARAPASIYATDTLDDRQPALDVTLSGRYNRTRVRNSDRITPAGEPGRSTATTRSSGSTRPLGVTFSPAARGERRMPATTKAAARPALDRARLRRSRTSPASCPTRWPATRRSTRS